MVHHDLLEVCVSGSKQAIIFVRGENGRHPEQAILSTLRKFVAKTGKFGWCSRSAPVGRQTLMFDIPDWQTFRYVGNSQNQIIWRIVFVEVNEIFQHCQRLVLGCIT